LNRSVNGFIPKNVIVTANRENSSMMIVAAFHEKFSSLSIGSKS
jgi:hypothetical protein